MAVIRVLHKTSNFLVLGLKHATNVVTYVNIKASLSLKRSKNIFGFFLNQWSDNEVEAIAIQYRNENRFTDEHRAPKAFAGMDKGGSRFSHDNNIMTKIVFQTKRVKIRLIPSRNRKIFLYVLNAMSNLIFYIYIYIFI